MSKVYTMRLAMTVVLTDRRQAVLFAALTREHVLAEIQEHFGDQDITMYFCPCYADGFLSDWPSHPEPWPRRRHVVSFQAIRHIIECAEVENE